MIINKLKKSSLNYYVVFDFFLISSKINLYITIIYFFNKSHFVKFSDF